MKVRKPRAFALDERGQPHPQDLIADLREALGLFAGAMPVTPQEAWEEAINEVHRLRERVG